MTTIAFKDNTFAADSRCSSNYSSRHTTRCDKLHRLKSGAILGCAGADDTRGLVALLDNIASSELLPDTEALSDIRQNTTALLLFPNGDLWQIEIDMIPYENTDEWNASVFQIKEPFAAIGSGEEFALGAMEFGATAEEAVKCACKWDLNSALPVITMGIDTPIKRRKSPRNSQKIVQEILEEGVKSGH